MEKIESVEQLIGITEVLPNEVICLGMLFLMKQGIFPMWEDPQNRMGGAFSYKVTNMKEIPSVWKTLMYLLCGGTLMVNPQHQQNVNGITISPKRNFCIIKIWMRDCSLQDPALVTHIPALMETGCMFTKHKTE
jgi:hypothetical protein